MTTYETKQQIIDTVRALGRPGTDAVIDYLLSSSYFRRGCYSHHREFGGLAAHSLEVYQHMLAHASGLPTDSLAVVGLFHDLGKTRRRHHGRGHGRRSVEILDELGYELTADERTIIARHHDRTLTPDMCPFRRPFKRADCNSAYTWNLAKGFIH